MFHSVSLLSQAPLARGSRALPNVLLVVVLLLLLLLSLVLIWHEMFLNRKCTRMKNSTFTWHKLNQDVNCLKSSLHYLFQEIKFPVECIKNGILENKPEFTAYQGFIQDFTAGRVRQFKVMLA